MVAAGLLNRGAMRRLEHGLLTALVVTFCATTPAVGRTVDEKQLVIFSAIADRGSSTLTIRGVNLGALAAVVYCEEQTMTILSATDEQIVAQLPGYLADGTYLLTVMRGKSMQARGAFNFSVHTLGPGSVGSVGPVGPVGPIGPMGRWVR